MVAFRPRFETLNDLLARSLAAYRDAPLFGVRTSGVFRFGTYGEFGERVAAVRAALDLRGIGRGDHVALIANNRPEWAEVAYATYGLGATFVPMYESQLEGDWEHILRDSAARIVFVPGQVIARRILTMRARLPAIEVVVVLEGPLEKDMLPYRRLVEEGTGRECPVRAVGAEDVATTIYTSGTTGRPKGVMLTHGNIASNVSAIHEIFPASSSDRSLSFLPWAHVFGQTVELHGMISIGGSIGITASVDRLLEDMLEVRPTLLFAVPRVFNRIADGLVQRFERRGGLEKQLFDRGIANARHLRKLAAQRRTSGIADLERLVYDRVLFSKIRDGFGGRLRYAISGGAALSKETAEFIDDLGITVFEGYGLTETSPIVTANRPGARKFGSVGKPIPGIRIEIDTAATSDPKHGEIVVFGHNVMKGYHHLPDEDARVFVASRGQRGFRTGDLGYLDGEGFLHITGRLKEQYKLENGKYVAPSPLEDALRNSPFIANAMVYGDDREFNVAILVPDFDALGRYARSIGLAADPRSLVGSERVRNLLADEIDKYSVTFRPYEKIRSFVVGDEDFTIENGMLTPSLKVKRREVLKRYGDALEALYGR